MDETFNLLIEREGV